MGLAVFCDALSLKYPGGGSGGVFALLELLDAAGADRFSRQLRKGLLGAAEDAVGGIFPQADAVAVQVDLYIAPVQLQQPAHLRRDNDSSQLIDLPYDSCRFHVVISS